jgi:hypothetical protein
MDKEQLTIKDITVSADRTHMLLEIPGLKKEHVVYFRMPNDLLSTTGNTIWSTEGGRVQVRDVHRAYGYQASHDPRQVFGLGSSARVEEVEVRWNDGATETFGPFMPGALHVLRRGQGR